MKQLLLFFTTSAFTSTSILKKVDNSFVEVINPTVYYTVLKKIILIFCRVVHKLLLREFSFAGVNVAKNTAGTHSFTGFTDAFTSGCDINLSTSYTLIVTSGAKSANNIKSPLKQDQEAI